ncbi:MAG: ribosome biogenesis GTPase YlqF [Deltaproteobacteria bacterium]|nr:ribosome biogenesis GTPase YlqF [Deltaproteobacteria bacterium]
MSVNWFPKHMRSSEEVLRKNLKFADVIFEVLDARIPHSSRDPRIDQVIHQKPRIVVLNKCDLSDENSDRAWIEYFKRKGLMALNVNATQGEGIKRLAGTARGMVVAGKSRFKVPKDQKRAVSAMVVGIPNVGKSTIINAVAGKKKARIANKPGVTRVKQRVTTPMGLELLDTPGILWPRDDEKTLLKLAMTGAVKDELLDLESLSISLLEQLTVLAPERLRDVYGVEVAGKESHEILEEVALKRGCIQKNRGIDHLRVSCIVLGDFRKGKLGRITLEMPEDDG